MTTEHVDVLSYQNLWERAPGFQVFASIKFSAIPVHNTDNIQKGENQDSFKFKSFKLESTRNAFFNVFKKNWNDLQFSHQKLLVMGPWGLLWFTLVTGITKEKLLLMLQAVYLQAMVQHLECSMK